MAGEHLFGGKLKDLPINEEREMMNEQLPFEIREAIVSVFGKAFWLKDPLRDFFLACGVPSEVYDRYADESKFKIARHVLSELDSVEGGHLIQRKIVTELCKLKKVPDQNVPDMDAAIEALRWLKELAVGQKITVEDEQKISEVRAQ
jgi:hypothetical protein